MTCSYDMHNTSRTNQIPFNLPYNSLIDGEVHSHFRGNARKLMDAHVYVCPCACICVHVFVRVCTFVHVCWKSTFNLHTAGVCQLVVCTRLYV